MALPSGYRELAYIKSSGTQYIDTGFKPNNNTRVVMDVQAVGTSGTYFLFGARQSNTSNSFCFFYYNGWAADFKTSDQRKTISGISFTDSLHIDYNKAICTVNGVSASFSDATFQSPVNMQLFAINTNGTISGNISANLYSCQIYDNGNLVRDFVPAKRTSDDVVGLYDVANGAFYTNSGTGSFVGVITTGPVDGVGASIVQATSYGIVAGKTIVDGTAYDIFGGRTLVSGTVFDIAFGVPLGSIPEGTLVYVNENGSPAAFYVAKHNYESGINGDGRTLLVRKGSFGTTVFSGSTTYARYTNSTLDNEVNSYKNVLDASVQSAIGNGTSFYTVDTNNNLVSIKRYCFSLSLTELGYDSSVVDHPEGSALPICETLKTNGQGWLRSISKYNNAMAYYQYDGGFTSQKINNRQNYIPAFTLPAATLVNPSDYLVTG